MSAVHSDMMPETHRRGLGLRGRLTIFFIVITVVPLLVAVLALQLQIDRQLQLRSEEELRSVRQAAVALIEARRARTADVATDVTAALVPEPMANELGTADDVQGWLEEQLAGEVPGRTDVVAIVAAEGEVVASVGREPDFADPAAGSEVSDLGPAARDGVLVPGVLLVVRELRSPDGDEALGWVVSALWTDDELLEALDFSGGAAITAGSSVLAVAGGSAQDVPVRRSPVAGEASLSEEEDGTVLLVSAPLGQEGAVDQDVELVVWSPQPERTSSLAVVLLALLPAVLIAGGLGWVIAGSVVGPVRRAAAVARAVAAGDLSRQLEPGGGPELTDMAVALNTMSAELSARLEELEQSQARLRGSLTRLGQTLSSSLDLNRTLSVIVETAMDTLGADRALLLLFTPERDGLYAKVGRGMGQEVPRLPVDGSRLGFVAQTAQPLRLPSGEDDRPVPEAAPGEPVGHSQLAVPMLGRGRVLGVLTLFIDDELRQFTQTDLDTMRSFGAQASVAIENVMLHQEAQRLSVTDPLTGLWNFRYFQLQADREVESAARSERPLSLIVVDIDHFKPVNDTYGHQVGDEILIEMARRLRDSTRVPDVVARYGGEEFVVLLPATDLAGAEITAERIRTSFATTPVEPTAPGVTATAESDAVEPIRITCSVGVATLPEHGRTAAALLRSADSAMYAAKQQGRNRVVAAGGDGGLDGGGE